MEIKLCDKKDNLWVFRRKIKEPTFVGSKEYV